MAGGRRQRGTRRRGRRRRPGAGVGGRPGPRHRRRARRRRSRRCSRTDVPVLVDADALTVCAQHPDGCAAGRPRRCSRRTTASSPASASEVAADRVGSAPAARAGARRARAAQGRRHRRRRPGRAGPRQRDRLAGARHRRHAGTSCRAARERCSRRGSRPLDAGSVGGPPARAGRACSRRTAPRRRRPPCWRPGRTPSARLRRAGRRMRSEARIDLAAIRDNVAVLRDARPAARRSWRSSRPTGTGTGWCRRRGPRSRAGPPGWASRSSRRRSPLRGPASTRRCWPG